MGKIFFLVSVFCTYTWFIGLSENKTAYQAARSVYEYCCRLAKEQKIRLHIHTPECFLQEKE